MGQTIRLKVDGSVSLSDFGTVVGSFVELVSILTAETDPDVVIDWVVSELSAGSATIATRGCSETVIGQHTIEQVTTRFAELGKRARQGDVSEFSTPVQNAVQRLTSVVNGRIPALRFETETEHWDVESAIADLSQPAEEMRFRAFVRTALRGQIVTLDQKQGLYFTLQDPHTKANARCYPPRKRARDLGAMWGRFVTVEGTLNRVATIPTMTAITDIVVHEEPKEDDWREAIGSAIRPVDGSTDTPQSAIRKVRDG